jgi:SAM-dependent methyltransferase
MRPARGIVASVITGDAFGEMLRSLAQDGAGVEIIERDDGFISASNLGPSMYLAPFRRWRPVERQAMRFARGRVLDIGAGAGRVALHLQERGHEVVAIDVSPGAVQLMQERGVRDARLLGINDVGPELGTFDTVVLYGNNIGLLGSPQKGARILRRWLKATSDDARILGTSIFLYDTENPVHLGYHERNLSRGRHPGQLRLRIRHDMLATPWFDYLMLPPDELDALAREGGWHVTRTFTGEGPIYSAVLEKL